MKYKAIIFDLFGTLVSDLGGPQYDDILKRVASILSVPTDDFRRIWSDTVYLRHTGVFQSVEANIIHICQELGIKPNSKNIKLAARIRQDYARRIMMKPRSDAMEVLSTLKQRRRKIALISNCTPDAPAIWPETPFNPMFDITVFSCSVGLKKPDHQIYKLTIERLGVESKDCLYVSNGQSGELRSAYEVAMYPVLITANMDEGFLSMTPDKEEIILAKREGAVISSLEEVLSLVD